MEKAKPPRLSGLDAKTCERIAVEVDTILSRARALWFEEYAAMLNRRFMLPGSSGDDIHQANEEQVAAKLVGIPIFDLVAAEYVKVSTLKNIRPRLEVAAEFAASHLPVSGASLAVNLRDLRFAWFVQAVAGRTPGAAAARADRPAGARQKAGPQVGGKFPKRAAWLKAEIEKQGLTPYKLAQGADSIDEKTFYSVMAGRRCWPKTLEKLAGALRVPLSEIPNE